MTHLPPASWSDRLRSFADGDVNNFSFKRNIDIVVDVGLVVGDKLLNLNCAIDPFWSVRRVVDNRMQTFQRYFNSFPFVQNLASQAERLRFQITQSREAQCDYLSCSPLWSQCHGLYFSYSSLCADKKCPYYNVKFNN